MILEQKWNILGATLLILIAGGTYLAYAHFHKQAASDKDIQAVMDAIKKVEAEQPSRVGSSTTEAEIYASPYIKHIRVALNGYLDGSNIGVEDPTPYTAGDMNCGLDNFDKSYYKSKFIVLGASDGDYGGVQATIVFVNKPDTIFWAWVYRLGGDGEYVLRAFCRSGPSDAERAKFEIYINGAIKDTKYLL